MKDVKMIKDGCLQSIVPTLLIRIGRGLHHYFHQIWDWDWI